MKILNILIFISVLMSQYGICQNPGSYFIKSAVGDKYLDVKGGQTADGTPLHLWSFNGSKAQIFTLEKTVDGYFYIKSELNKYLHVQNRSDQPKALALIWQGKGNDNTKWKLRPLGDGYYSIQSKKGTFLTARDGVDKQGTPIWMWTKNNSNAQRWKLQATIIKGNKSDMKMTSFNPNVHGFQFSNFGFRPNDHFADIFKWSGFCGGMTYAAADYYYSNKTTPNQDYSPAPGTNLYNYLWSRQSKSIENVAGQVAEFEFNPDGTRNDEFWRWGVNEKLKQLITNIDNNMPTPICLLRESNEILKDIADNHWVLAIGYDLGGYSWKMDKDPKLSNLRIFVYDPNKPNGYRALKPLSENGRLIYHFGDIEPGTMKFTKKSRWNCISYHSNTHFFRDAQQPPTVQSLPNGRNDNIHMLVVKCSTGSDDLRGGNDQLTMEIFFSDGSSEMFRNVNKSQRWRPNGLSNVELRLKKKVLLKDIKSVVLSTNFGGGISGENWDLSHVNIDAYSGSGRVKRNITNNDRMRFTGLKRNLTLLSKHYKPQVIGNSGGNKQISLEMIKFDSPIHNNDCRRIQGSIKVRCFNSSTLKEYPAVNNVAKIVEFSGNKIRDFNVVNFDQRIPNQTVRFNIDVATYNAKNFYFLLDPDLKRCHKSCDLCSDYHCNIKYNKNKIKASSIINNTYKGVISANDARSNQHHNISVVLKIQ